MRKTISMAVYNLFMFYFQNYRRKREARGHINLYSSNSHIVSPISWNYVMIFTILLLSTWSRSSKQFPDLLPHSECKKNGVASPNYLSKFCHINFCMFAFYCSVAKSQMLGLFICLKSCIGIMYIHN